MNIVAQCTSSVRAVNFLTRITRDLPVTPSLPDNFTLSGNFDSVGWEFVINSPSTHLGDSGQWMLGRLGELHWTAWRQGPSWDTSQVSDPIWMGSWWTAHLTYSAPRVKALVTLITSEGGIICKRVNNVIKEHHPASPFTTCRTYYTNCKTSKQPL